MNSSIGSLPVADDEQLARYIVQPSDVRQDGTVRPDPFIPYKYVELSVTRHLDLEGDEVWHLGDDVANQLEKPLRGRADTFALSCVKQGLRALNKPIHGNPHHADICGWPADKPSQKQKALEIARDAKYVARPENLIPKHSAPDRSPLETEAVVESEPASAPTDTKVKAILIWLLAASLLGFLIARFAL